MRTSAVSGLVAGTLIGAQLLAMAPSEAADLGDGRRPRPPREYAQPYYEQRHEYGRWTGFYLGGTLGYSWADTQVNGDIGSFSLEQDGAAGTIFAGYNWQIGRAVLGLETDVGTGNLGSRTATAFGTLETDYNVMGSFRGRAGVLLTPALLLYGTAGFAWANMDVGFAGQTHQSETFFGYQVGGGTEFMFTSNVTLRLEYIFTDLERDRITHSGQTNQFDPDIHTVRAGVSFKF